MRLSFLLIAYCLLCTKCHSNNAEEVKSSKEWEIKYDSFGKIKSKIHFLNNQIDSTITYDNEHGWILKRTYEASTLVFQQTFNADSTLQNYQVFRKNGFVQHVILFDSAISKSYENGYIFDEDVEMLNYLSDTVQINKPVSFKIYTTVIPNYSTKVHLYFFGANKKKVQVNDSVLVAGRYTYGTFTPPSLGPCTLVLIGELNDENNRLAFRDTLFKNIFVN